MFFILAPAIVFYVSGIAFDFSSRRLVKTGSFVINTDPNKAEIFLNGALARKNSGNIKFLTPGEYDIKIQAPGYFDWTKRFSANQLNKIRKLEFELCVS